MILVGGLRVLCVICDSLFLIISVFTEEFRLLSKSAI